MSNSLNTSNIRDIKVQEIEVNFDRVRHIRYDLNALGILDERFGSINEAFEELGKMKAKAITTMLWAGLIHEDEELTEKYVGSLIGMGNIAEIMSIISETLGVALPEAKNSEPSPME